MTIKIGIIGYGVVGRAAANTFSEKYDLIIYDKYMDSDDFMELKSTDFVFIMVPTPFDCQKNVVDDSSILESLDGLEKLGYANPIVIKSTLPTGKCMEYSERYSS